MWKATVNPLEITYIPSGQKIFFRGMDDAQSITSITVEDGYLCWVWWEEAFQCSNEDEFNKVDLSIRGVIPEPLFKQHTFTFNPWSDKIWLKKRFFDKADGKDIFALTTNYQCNEWLGEDDLEIFAKMKLENPRRYNIEGMGDWGIAEGLIYNNWQEMEFDISYFLNAKDMKGNLIYRDLKGLDFGYTNDPSAFVCMLIDTKARELYIFDEMYQRGMINDDIFKKINSMGYAKERIVADSAEPKSIFELKRLGLRRIKASKKG